MEESEFIDFDLAESLGATELPIGQKVTLYFPNKDRAGNLLNGTSRSSDGKILPNVETYIQAAMHLLADINRGVTRFPWADGQWMDRDHGRIEESTTLIYSYLREVDEFIARFDELSELIRRFGKDTNQSEVLVEHSGETDDGSYFCRAYVISFDDY